MKTEEPIEYFERITRYLWKKSGKWKLRRVWKEVDNTGEMRHTEMEGKQ